MQVCVFSISQLQGLERPYIAAMVVDNWFAHTFLALTEALIDMKTLPCSVSDVVKLRDRELPNLRPIHSGFIVVKHFFKF